jgi:predicted Zn-dependent protease
VLARTGVVAVAVVVLAWLGVMERGFRLQERATAALREGEPARAEADLRAARLLNPDAGPDISRAVIYRGSGREEEAVALLEDVVAREPDNLTAWAVMRASAEGVDAAASRRALDELRRLDPVNVPDVGGR